MPRIIQPPDDENPSIADSLRSLGDSMFDNQAQRALIGQGVAKQQRQAKASADASKAYAAGDLVNYGANVVLNNPDSPVMGINDLARAAMMPGSNPASLATLQIGAGLPVQYTVPGQSAALTNNSTIAGMGVGENAHQFNFTPYPTTDANGNPIVSTNQRAIGTAPIPTPQSVAAKALQGQLY